MKLEVLEQSDDRVVLRVDGVHPSFLNAIRRTLIADVPKMAIDEVTIYDNTSALFDEVVAHRLGLVPIPTDLQAFVARDQCTCNAEGCANCTILYTLSKEGPCTVYSGDLTPADPRFKIKDPKIPLVKLLEGQRVMLEAAAMLGTGSKQTKWSSVTAVGHTEAPSVQIDAGTPIPAATLQELQKLAPERSVAFEDGKLRVVDEARAWHFLRSVQELHEVPGVKLSSHKDKFVMTVETDGALTAREAVKAALGILMEKLKGVEQGVTELKVEATEPAPQAA